MVGGSPDRAEADEGKSGGWTGRRVVEVRAERKRGEGGWLGGRGSEKEKAHVGGVGWGQHHRLGAAAAPPARAQPVPGKALDPPPEPHPRPAAATHRPRHARGRGIASAAARRCSGGYAAPPPCSEAAAIRTSKTSACPLWAVSSSAVTLPRNGSACSARRRPSARRARCAATARCLDT